MKRNRKVLVGTGLLIASSLIIPYQTKAASNFGTISITNPNNPDEGFTIMDRNLGATEVGAGKNAPYNSYGNCYQRGNNYGFPCKGEITNITKNRIDASGYGPNNPYSNPRFIDDDFYWDETNNHNLRGGEDDKENRGYPIKNFKERQGPCPDGYHVPSAGEWSKVLEFWCNSNPEKCNIKSNNGLNYTKMEYDIGLSFANDLKLPFAGYRRTNDSTSFEGSSIDLWTSSPSNDTYEGYSYCLSLTERIHDMSIGAGQDRYRSKALPIRCFKNTYTPKTSKDSITGCEGMENAKVSHNINDDKITLKWNIIEGDNVEISIYDPENEKYKNIGKINMNNGKFVYKARREGEHKFKLSNGCNDLYYEIDGKQIFLEDNTNMDGQLNEINSMSFGTISIVNPDNPDEGFTIMDRNLGATTNDINNINSYGYKYQWGNNYGFQDGCTTTDGKNCSDSVTNKATYVGAIRNDEYNNNGYFNKKFIKGVNYRDGVQDHNGLRGGNNDSYTNNWGLDIISKTVNKRQGPCPKGYHVPSAGEWEKLAEYRAKQNNYPKVSSVRGGWTFADYSPYNDTPRNEFQKYFKLPPAGYRYYEDGTIGKYEDGYRSSSPTSPTEAKVVMLLSHSVLESKQYKTFGYSIRCFKNTYEPGVRGQVQGDTKTEKKDNNITENKNNKIDSSKKSDNNENSKTKDNKVEKDSEIKTNNKTTDKVVIPAQTFTYKQREESNGNPSDILQNGYSREMNNAYNFAHTNGLTTSSNIDKAKMNSPLTRIAMAKILSNYAINILGKQPDTSKGTKNFNDVTAKQNADYDNAVTLSYQLGIMGQGTNKFRPNDEVTRAEFATALSRMLYSTPDGKDNYYSTHLNKLKQEGIISNDNPKAKEKRGYVMLMLMRTVK